MPDQYSINHKDKYSSEDFINCEFDLAETVKMRKDGKFYLNKLFDKKELKYHNIDYEYTCLNK